MRHFWGEETETHLVVHYTHLNILSKKYTFPPSKTFPSGVARSSSLGYRASTWPYIGTETCTRMFVATVFTTVKQWTNPSTRLSIPCSSTTGL